MRSAHARYAEHTAAKLGYGFRSLDGADGYLFEVRDGARRAYLSAGSGWPYALNRASAAAIARDKAFTQSVLEDRGVAAIPTRIFFTHKRHAALRDPGREPEDALAFARTAAFPLFCKPLSGAQGAFAEIVPNAGAFARYLARIAEHHYAMLVQPVIEADEYRVFVLQGRALFSYRKLAPNLMGDGASTLAQLADRAAQAVRPDEALFAPSETLSAADAKGKLFGANDTPPSGVSVTLKGAANRALGGASADFTTAPPPTLARIALDAASAIGLDLAAVDLFDQREGGPVVIEVNANPAIKTLEDHGRWDLIEQIWQANFEAALR